MNELQCDAAIIGAGAAGMASAIAIAGKGREALLLDREDCLGGILQQCIHTGFGLHRFQADLSGPEYAERDVTELRRLGIRSLLGTTVLRVEEKGDEWMLEACSLSRGALRIRARAVVLAMGSRERNRGNCGIPGTRPAGVFTAGLAQRLVNLEGYLPGKRVVIMGSGDIGLIMARRLTWAGCSVLGVVEILPYPSGLARNIAQCLEDYGIPLLLAHAVTRIHGSRRVEGVDIAPWVNGVADLARMRHLPCDAVLLSVGLIPENELSRGMGVALSPATGGPLVDSTFMTNKRGVFACGNVLHIHDLVDHVSEESARCGAAVVAYLEGAKGGALTEGPVRAGANLKYVLPARYRINHPQCFSMRALAPLDRAVLAVSCAGQTLASRSLRYVRPAEMIVMDLGVEALLPLKEMEMLAPLEFALHARPEGAND